ncbi:MAG: endo-1,4-beta-xylanase [Planctomycetota bacterium]
MFKLPAVAAVTCTAAAFLLPPVAAAQDAPPLIDGTDPATHRSSVDNGADATIEVIDVEGQPFDRAVRVTVNEPIEPIWSIQVLTANSAEPVAAGDTLVGSFMIRAEPVGGSTPEVWGYLQNTAGEFEQLAWLGGKPTTAWTRREFKAVAQRDYAAGALSVSLHLGLRRQVVEIADIRVERQPPEPGVGEPAEPMTNPLDADLIERLGPDARLIVPGNRPADLRGPGPAVEASLQLVGVAGQPFVQAARVRVDAAVQPVWNAQLTSPDTTGPIRRGDVLLGLIDVRAESRRESGGGQFTAWLQAPGNAERGWTELRRLAGAPGGRWSRRFFTAVADRDFAAGEVNLAMHLGVIPQSVDVANILLWNLGPDADVDVLPRTRLTYEGQEPDAPWRAEAMRRIDEHRKADLTVEVVDAAGRPVPDATVHAVLDRHAFGFGTFIDRDTAAIGDSEDDRRYREVLFHHFNRLTAPSYGAQTWGWPDPETAERYARTIDWAVSNGFQTKAHTLIWSRFDWSPAAWSAARDDPARLRAAMEDYVHEIMPRLESLGVHEVDFWNEPASFDEIDRVLTDPALRADFFKLGQSLAPSAKLFINEHTILSAGGLNTARQDAYAAIIQDLLDRDAPLAGIGMQGHMGEDFTPPTRIWKILDRFADFGLPIQVTELDINTGDHLTQAEYTRDFFLAALAHPAVQSVTVWGFWAPEIWIPGAEMWRDDWSLKPNGEAFVKLLTETLHTDEQTTTDPAGRAVVRGFHGDYRVTVTHGDQNVHADAKLTPAGDTLRVVLD